MAKDYHCDLCHQPKKAQPARAAGPPRGETVNSIVGVDTIYLPVRHTGFTVIWVENSEELSSS